MSPGEFVKNYVSGRKLIFSIIPVMLTGLCGYLFAGKPDGEFNGRPQPVEKASPGILAKTKNCPSKEENEVMSQGEKGRYDRELIKRLSLIKEPGKRSGRPLKTIKVPDFGGKHSYTLTLDLSGQVLRLDIPKDLEFGLEKRSQPAPLHRSFSELKGLQDFISAAALAYKAKQFDDGLMAAVELAANSGAGTFPAKRDLLDKMTKDLSQGDMEGEGLQAASILTAAAQLGGLRSVVPEALARSAEKMKREFLNDPSRSKPLGFYTWNEDLVRLFQQDRMLQTEMDEPSALLLARFLGREPSWMDSYDAALGLAEKLTNPLAGPDLRKVAADLSAGRKAEVKGKMSFFPPSKSPETELIKKLYGNRPIPEGFNLADEIVRRIRTGELSLQPGMTSGWYDHQIFALEPLTIPEKTPEAEHLEFSEEYKKELIGLLKGLMALTRETHIKQVEIPTAGAAPPSVEIRPDLSLEPLASYYLRRAESYRIVEKVLQQAFGGVGLSSMRRITADGSINLPLDQELNLLQRIFLGAYQVVCDEVGMVSQSGKEVGSSMDREVFRAWSASPEKDPDLKGDIRMMVPVFYDVERKQMKVWAVLGLATKNLRISFARPPAIRAFVDGSGKKADPGQITYETDDRHLAYFVTAEAYVTRILDRQEFREHCDRHKTEKAILRNLK